MPGEKHSVPKVRTAALDLPHDAARRHERPLQWSRAAAMAIPAKVRSGPTSTPRGARDSGYATTRQRSAPSPPYQFVRMQRTAVPPSGHKRPRTPWVLPRGCGHA